MWHSHLITTNWIPLLLISANRPEPISNSIFIIQCRNQHNYMNRESIWNSIFIIQHHIQHSYRHHKISEATWRSRNDIEAGTNSSIFPLCVAPSMTSLRVYDYCMILHYSKYTTPSNSKSMACDSSISTNNKYSSNLF